MTKKEQLKLIDDAFYSLDFLNNKTWTHYLDEYLALNVKEEKEHDRLRPDGTRRGITIKEAGKLFCVSWIAQYLLNMRTIPTAKDFLHIRKSAFYSAALTAEFEEEIRAAWKGLDIKALADLDYVKLIEA